MKFLTSYSATLALDLVLSDKLQLHQTKSHLVGYNTVIDLFPHPPKNWDLGFDHFKVPPHPTAPQN